MSDRARVFDALAASAAERDALSRLRTATGEIGGAMERHSLRVRHIAAEIAARRGWTVDGEILTVAAILHDVGLYPDASRGGVYTADGAALAVELVRAHGWSEARAQRCADAIERHHELRGQLARGAEVQALRLADLVDVSGGVIAAGLPRAWVRRLREEIPVTGLGRELWREVGRALRERPLTLPRIFLRP